MAVIAFFIDYQEGHILPSFGLAHALKKDGHAIIYISTLDNEKIVQEQGFDFVAILEDVFPKGYNQIAKKTPQKDGHTLSGEKDLVLRLRDGELDHFFKRSNPDLFIATNFLILESLLLYYKYKIRIMILATYLRSPDISLLESCIRKIMTMPGDIVTTSIEFVLSLGFKFSSLREFVQPVTAFSELVLCPGELEMDQQLVENGTTFYIGPSIRPETDRKKYPELNEIANRKRIIYASMGSYAISYGEACELFFKLTINVMRHKDLQNLHLVLAVGAEYSINTLMPVPENVTVLGWASQIDIIKVASLVITHGGMGTVKESIYYGVPMIVLPIDYDQPRNAMLIEHHRLGISEQIEHMTEEKLRSHILYVLNNNAIKENIKRMKGIFRAKEEAQDGVTIINKFIRQVPV